MTALKKTREVFDESEPVIQATGIIDPNVARKIEELAYYKAEARGFELGHELEDWIEAERELLGSV